ncbi:PGN_0703 family putative restriction endonuclease [Pontixanthobacter aquaemixtae]|uniref:PD-(D/E)XK nuclease-like domain-containing protein n=1 Tax=Pontixanthobacter aquaemixtae TaxID=1958940 RepID=A0A844ZXL7_9SPHN|nr:hypothetical protein [Pontixanthobacter aquaemixtae]MXO91497.1 hypothetical protein [Pontixanthobacter aquaemixtae]
MLTSLRQPVRQLPLVPADLLKSHDVYEKFDTRFRACARLLQSLWREAQELPCGQKRSTKGRSKRLGSRLAAKAAIAGRNFLTPAIAALADVEIAYQERGALIDRDRLSSNLLSSMPLAFNLAGPWRLDPQLAAKILCKLFPSVKIKRVLHVWFEHSPNRLDPNLTGDRSALDIAVVFERPDGKRGLIGFEIKYSEDSHDGSNREPQSPFDELAKSSDLYKEPDHSALRVRPMQQLFREHLLCYAALRQELYAETHFALVAPCQNHRIERLQTLYSAFLKNAESGIVPFRYLELETIIAAFAEVGEEDYATLLFERYCDWQRLDNLIEGSITRSVRDWSVRSAPNRPDLSLVASAA